MATIRVWVGSQTNLNLGLACAPSTSVVGWLALATDHCNCHMDMHIVGYGDMRCISSVGYMKERKKNKIIYMYMEHL